MDAAALAFALPIAHRLRRPASASRSSTAAASLKAKMKRADKLRARAAIIIGGNEVASGKLTVKDLAQGTQSGSRPPTSTRRSPAPRLAPHQKTGAPAPRQIL